MCPPRMPVTSWISRFDTVQAIHYPLRGRTPPPPQPSWRDAGGEAMSGGPLSAIAMTLRRRLGAHFCDVSQIRLELPRIDTIGRHHGLHDGIRQGVLEGEFGGTSGHRKLLCG